MLEENVIKSKKGETENMILKLRWQQETDDNLELQKNTRYMYVCVMS